MDAQQPWTQAFLNMQVSKRKAEIAIREVLKPNQVLSVSSAAITVFGIGVLEARMLTARGPRPRGAWKFYLRYGALQILPSIIWLTKPAEVVVRSMGRHPSTFLRRFDLKVLADARASLRVTSLQNARSIIAGFVGIAQILCLVDSATNSHVQFMTRVRDGKEPLLTGIPDRVIRLVGRESDVTCYSIKEDGLHLVPVLENPSSSSARELLSSMHSSSWTMHPVYWNVPTGMYGKKDSWKGFHMERNWFQTTVAGRRILIVEGDGSVGEQALALGNESANDLSLQEASQAFRMIKKLAIRDGAIKVVGQTDEGTPQYDGDVVRVLLTDPEQTLLTGSGHKYTVREHLSRYQEVDILIDAKKPLIKCITQWVERAYADLLESHPSADRVIVFNTNNQEYYQTVKQVLGEDGWTVIDQSQRGTDYDTSLELVYQDSTADTINTMRSLLSLNLVSTRHCCALLDSQEGIEEISDLETELGVRVNFLCSALLYDSLFRFVRRQLLASVPYATIQQELEHIGTEPSLDIHEFLSSNNLRALKKE